MPQLVGRDCVFCRERISSELESRFCPSCGNPTHLACSRRALASPEAGSCPGCGAGRAAVTAATEARREEEAAKHGQAAMQTAVTGAGLLVVGLVATILGSCLVFSSGRVYVSGWVIFAGLALIVRGLVRTRRR